MTDDENRHLDIYVSRIEAGEVLSGREREHYESLCEQWLDEEENAARRAMLGGFI